MIGILCIALGKYKVFWKELYEGCEKFFIKNMAKHYYVFTDDEDLIYKNNENVSLIKQEDLGWPKDTLFRFKMFNSISDRLAKETDFLFFFNINLMPIKEVTDSFLPKKENLLVVMHPGYYKNTNPDSFPYCRNKKSTAYIQNGKGKIYAQGALNGGKTAEFLKMIDSLSKKTDTDLEKKIIATVHDESHLNKYILDRKDVKIVGPEYIYPEGWNLDDIKDIFILSRDKSKYFDIEKIKLSPIRYFLKKITNRII